MEGDILFYQGVSMWDSLIQKWTNSPYCHVAIDLGDNTIIEALSQGIVRSPYREPATKFILKDNSTDYDESDLRGALRWLQSMRGHQYGWSDIASAASLLHRFVYLVRPNYYDCSALAAEFLVRAGGVELGDLGSDPHLSTPGALARQLKNLV